MHYYMIKIYSIIKFNGNSSWAFTVVSDCTENAIVTACKKLYCKGFKKEYISDINCYDMGELKR